MKIIFNIWGGFVITKIVKYRRRIGFIMKLVVLGVKDADKTK
jgi:hypothetical protein